MKHFIFFFTLGIMTSFSSCVKDEPTTPEKSDTHSIRISLSAPVTRASDPGEKIEKGAEGIINCVHVYVVTSTGMIYASKEFTKDPEEDWESDWYKLTRSDAGYKFSGVTGSATHVVVLGNPVTELLPVGQNVNLLNGVVTLESQQDISNLLYMGSNKGVCSPLTPDPEETDVRVLLAEVTLQPVVARFQINSVYYQTDGAQTITKNINEGVSETANIEWKGFTGQLKGIYMNRFYRTSAISDIMDLKFSGAGLLFNSTVAGTIRDGEWLFNGEDLSSFASYNKWNGSNYEVLPGVLNDPESWAFNFLPGEEYPIFHLDLSDMKCDWFISDNNDLFGETHLSSYRFANLIKYVDEKDNILSADDFVPGKLYNVSIEIKPGFLTDDFTKDSTISMVIIVKVMNWDYIDLNGGFE